MTVASASVAPLLRGRVRRVEVLAAMPAAVYLVEQGGAAEVIALLAPGAVRVPFGVVVPGPAGPPAARVGDLGAVGGGRLVLGGLDVRPVRWWDPSVRPGSLPVGAPAVDAAAALRAALDADPSSHLLPPEVAHAADRFECCLLDGGSLDDAAHPLIGLGPGLTPAGDDVLAGVLVALAALARGTPATDSWALGTPAPIGEGWAGRTTGVSGALLREAAAGRAIPQVLDVIVALAALPSGAAAAPGRAARLGAGVQRLGVTVQRLGRVGHTSGVALGRGLLAGLRIASRHGREAAA